MHDISNTNTNNNGDFSIREMSKTKKTKRISAPKQPKLNGRKANLGMAYGKSVHGVVSAAVPGELYKQLVITSREEKINVSDIVRRGVMRELGAIRLARSLKMDPALYGVVLAGNASQKAADSKPKAASVDRATKVEARKAIRELRKALKTLAS